MLHQAVTFDKIKAEDNLALAEMIRTVFKEHEAPQQGTVYSDPTTDNLYDLFKTPKSILWVAKISNKVVGCCGVYPSSNLDASCVELVKFYLAKDARGKGIGKELMNRSILSAQEFGYQQLYLESIPVFSKAVGIYEKLGFRKLAQPIGLSGHSACNIWMLKEL